MNYAVVYSSLTGNTRRLAETIRDLLPPEQLVYCGEPDEKALEAHRIYAGFWTDKGTCDEKSAAFLKTLRNRQVFLFGTAGFGGAPGYYEQILGRVRENLDSSNSIVGTYLCQGSMPAAVRKRYEAMLSDPAQKERGEMLIRNFDQALSHPDDRDLENLKAALHRL